MQKVEPDVTGNAAALDVYAFLSLKFDGSTVFELIERHDPDLVPILSEDPVRAESLVRAFLSLKEHDASISSHALAKQVYWLVGDNPVNNSQYHLLAPLYASSLHPLCFSSH